MFSVELFLITKVKGVIIKQKDGNVLKRGDRILSTDQLKFVTPKAFAIALTPKRQKYYLRAVEQKGQILTVLASKVPIKEKNYLSTRAIVTNKPVTDLYQYLGDETFTVIGDELHLKLNRRNYTIDSLRPIVLKYNYEDTLYQTKYSDDQFVINKNDLKGIEEGNEKFVEKVEISQLIIPANLNKEITWIDFKFVEEKSLTDELRTIMDLMKTDGATDDEMKQFLREYFRDVYGKTDAFYLQTFIDKQFVN